MTTEVLNSFWVSCTGLLSGDAGEPLEREQRDRFAHAVSACLRKNDARTPGVFWSGSGKLVVSAVFDADDDPDALAAAKELFDHALTCAGVDAAFPDGSHPAWNSHQLLRESWVVRLVAA